jgi:purine nucleosidase
MPLNENTPRPILFDHDGGIDDLLSLLLLVRLPNVKLIGVSITPADCYADDALLTTQKLLALTGNEHVPVSVGNIAGPNPFPPEWRAQPKMCNALPSLLRVDGSAVKVSDLPAHEFMVNMLLESPDPVTVLMTGPASNLATAMAQHPNIVDKIEQVIWMGGAIEVDGNVAMHDHNKSAEWNAYWHPKATESLISSGVKLCLVPLDATNALPVNMDFLNTLAKVNTPVSDLAGQFWASTVTAIPSYEFTYFLWDILSTTVLALPPEKTHIATSRISVSTKTPNAGQTYLDEYNGTPVHWLKQVDADYVRTMVIHYLSGEFKQRPKPLS